MRYIAKKLGLPTHYVWFTLIGTAWGLAFIILLCKIIGLYFIIQGATFK
jgi:hypothetical protein